MDTTNPFAFQYKKKGILRPEFDRVGSRAETGPIFDCFVELGSDEMFLLRLHSIPLFAFLYARVSVVE